MRNKNTKQIIRSIIILGVIIMAFVVISHPFFKSPEKIMSEVIRLTPIGTHIDDVENLVNSKTIVKNVEEGHVPIINYERGYVSPGEIVPGWPVTDISKQSIVGHQNIEVFYKTHAGMFFSIYWGFDEEGKLIDVYVRKSWDKIQIGGIRKTAE